MHYHAPMTRRLPWLASGSLFSLFALGALVACPGGSLGGESGELCLDSKDNDGDGRADCDDSDCASLWLCRAGEIPIDLGPPPPPPDSGAQDRGPLPPDSGPIPASSYGQLCQWQGYVTLCPDQKSVCIRSPLGGAFCSFPCSGQGTCPVGPTGDNVAECFYSYNEQTYCVFLCMLYGAPHACPAAGYQCVDSGLASQKWCWP